MLTACKVLQLLLLTTRMLGSWLLVLGRLTILTWPRQIVTRVPQFRHCYYRLSKKSCMLWVNGHKYLHQTHPKSKGWECFGKFRIFATMWALRFSKLKKKWLRKWRLAEFTAHNMHSFHVPLHFHYLQWKQNLLHMLVEGKIKVVLNPWPDVP